MTLPPKLSSIRAAFRQLPLPCNVGRPMTSKTWVCRDFPEGPVVKTLLPLQGVRVQTLVRELRFHVLLGVGEKQKPRRRIS